MKVFDIKSCMLIWVISLTGIVEDLTYLRNNLEYFEKVQGNTSLSRCNFLIIMNDSLEDEVHKLTKKKGGFPLTEAEKTSDFKTITELIEKAFTQRFERKSDGSTFTRSLTFYYSHLCDNKLLTHIHSCFSHHHDICKS
ncbi:hypothetical protein RFI_12160 [Reticulomyxa filosa]|uniref:Uncharacterized protein n=1 Tax=Reticulomyxa filosa TaxID=46433 RepID=X6NGZ2_RETFI|nr:hypothetical protein RFI_12160 [Reticulomyxa filosa]|eukprot:ETO24984.1 hypothetical protein RFI_12160 [Reticulomyxa filosa]